jgi:hypothetical protein
MLDLVPALDAGTRSSNALHLTRFFEHRLAFPSHTGDVQFYVVRGFDWTTLTYHKVQTHAEKFSVHIIAKHPTHMFPDIATMREFLALVEGHWDWSMVHTNVDMKVYGRKQLFRAPCAVKAPPFNRDSCKFDLDRVQNIFLPVNPKTGAQERPILIPGRINIHLPLSEWSKYLVTSFHADVKAESFISTLLL